MVKIASKKQFRRFINSMMGEYSDPDDFEEETGMVRPKKRLKVNQRTHGKKIHRR